MRRLVPSRHDESAIGYYQQADLAFYGQAAPYWTVCDRYLRDHGGDLPFLMTVQE